MTEPRPDELFEAASIAHTMACEAFEKAAYECIHLHGGMGFTWEHDAHLYYRRARADRVLFGTEKPGTGSGRDPKTGLEYDDLKPVIEGIEFLSDEDLDLCNLTEPELIAYWNLWLEQAQVTNDSDAHTYSHGVFEVEPGHRAVEDL